MITLLIGGAEDCSLAESLWPKTRYPKLLLATESGSFKDFCTFAVESTKIIKHIDYKGLETKRNLANDDFAVHFSDKFLEKNLSRGTVMFKIATAVETAMDLGLDVEVFILTSEAEEALKNQWPEHWPKRKIVA